MATMKAFVPALASLGLVAGQAHQGPAHVGAGNLQGGAHSGPAHVGAGNLQGGAHPCPAFVACRRPATPRSRFGATPQLPPWLGLEPDSPPLWMLPDSYILQQSPTFTIPQVTVP